MSFLSQLKKKIKANNYNFNLKKIKIFGAFDQAGTVLMEPPSPRPQIGNMSVPQRQPMGNMNSPQYASKFSKEIDEYINDNKDEIAAFIQGNHQVPIGILPSWQQIKNNSQEKQYFLNRLIEMGWNNRNADLFLLIALTKSEQGYRQISQPSIPEQQEPEQEESNILGKDVDYVWLVDYVKRVYVGQYGPERAYDIAMDGIMHALGAPEPGKLDQRINFFVVNHDLLNDNIKTNIFNAVQTNLIVFGLQENVLSFEDIIAKSNTSLVFRRKLVDYMKNQFGNILFEQLKQLINSKDERIKSWAAGEHGAKSQTYKEDVEINRPSIDKPIGEEGDNLLSVIQQDQNRTSRLRKEEIPEHEQDEISKTISEFAREYLEDILKDMIRLQKQTVVQYVKDAISANSIREYNMAEKFYFYSEAAMEQIDNLLETRGRTTTDNQFYVYQNPFGKISIPREVLDDIFRTVPRMMNKEEAGEFNSKNISKYVDIYKDAIKKGLIEGWSPNWYQLVVSRFLLERYRAIGALKDGIVRLYKMGYRDPKAIKNSLDANAVYRKALIDFSYGDPMAFIEMTIKQGQEQDGIADIKIEIAAFYHTHKNEKNNNGSNKYNLNSDDGIELMVNDIKNHLDSNEIFKNILLGIETRQSSTRFIKETLALKKQIYKPYNGIIDELRNSTPDILDNLKALFNYKMIPLLGYTYKSMGSDPSKGGDGYRTSVLKGFLDMFGVYSGITEMQNQGRQLHKDNPAITRLKRTNDPDIADKSNAFLYYNIRREKVPEELNDISKVHISDENIFSPKEKATFNKLYKEYGSARSLYRHRKNAIDKIEKVISDKIQESKTKLLTWAEEDRDRKHKRIPEEISQLITPAYLTNVKYDEFINILNMVGIKGDTKSLNTMTASLLELISGKKEKGRSAPLSLAELEKRYVAARESINEFATANGLKTYASDSSIRLAYAAFQRADNTIQKLISMKSKARLIKVASANINVINTLINNIIRDYKDYIHSLP